MKKQRILKVLIIIIVLLLMFVYWLMYWKIGDTAAEQYYKKKSGQIVTLSIIKDDYFPSLIDYDKMSRVYKRSISEDELNEANTDAKRLALYRKVQSLTKNPEKYSYWSNESFRQGDYHGIRIKNKNCKIQSKNTKQNTRKIQNKTLEKHKIKVGRNGEL